MMPVGAALHASMALQYLYNGHLTVSAAPKGVDKALSDEL